MNTQWLEFVYNGQVSHRLNTLSRVRILKGLIFCPRADPCHADFIRFDCQKLSTKNDVSSHTAIFNQSEGIIRTKRI